MAIIAKGRRSIWSKEKSMAHHPLCRSSATGPAMVIFRWSASWKLLLFCPLMGKRMRRRSEPIPSYFLVTGMGVTTSLSSKARSFGRPEICSMRYSAKGNTSPFHRRPTATLWLRICIWDNRKWLHLQANLKTCLQMLMLKPEIWLCLPHRCLLQQHKGGTLTEKCLPLGVITHLSRSQKRWNPK